MQRQKTDMNALSPTGLEEGIASAWQPAAVPDLNFAATAPHDLAIVVAHARAELERHQRPDGHFVFELEADATIPAEYVLL